MKAAIFFDQWFDEIETLYPLYRLKEAGFSVDLIAPYPVGTEIKGKYHYPLKNTHTLENFNSEYDLLLFPGGYAPDKVRRYPKILDFLADHAQKNKLVASICHGPWVLVSAQILKGRKATSTPAIKDDLINAGAHWLNETVVVDGNIITAQDASQTHLWMAAVLQAVYEKNIQTVPSHSF